MSSVLVMACEKSLYLSIFIVTSCMSMKRYYKILAPILFEVKENFEDGFFWS